MPKIESSTKPIIPLLVVALVAALAGGGYYLFSAPDNKAIPEHGPQEESFHNPQPDIASPFQPIPAETVAPGEKDPEAEQYRQAPMETKIQDPCLDIIKKLDAFFLYLDEQDYIKAYQFTKDSKAHIAQVITKILHSPPRLLTPEATTLQIISNNAHFFRVMGSQNLAIIRTIINNEPDMLEEILADFYTWTILHGQCRNRSFAISPELPELYPYAVFFLNSSAGQAYLKRRNNQVRLLATYYSIIIVHQSTGLGLNSPPLDITAPLGQLISELETNTDLSQKNQYLTLLYKIREESIIL